ncbi:hypothetical protein A5697_18795 [Mycobacterium sp. E3251]|nr:hypothetical protein A5697_18795 [Mycobacterium sp. E3251]OBI28348.1 hypothetical protein A5711_01990 [Mycobacterium sp. E2238]OBI31427.1 hypothetical protein A5709_24465 [Mycobacterium sp. E1386]
MYCSPACRQKAYRARSTRRMAVLRETLRRSVGRGAHPEAVRSLHRSVASSMERAREQLARSRELCRVSELRLRESDVICRESLRKRAARAASTSDTERAWWLGS